MNIGRTLREVVEDHVMEVPHGEKLVAVHLDHVTVVPLAKDQNRIRLDCHDIHYLERHSWPVVAVDRMFEREVALFEQSLYQILLLLLFLLVLELVEQLVLNFPLFQTAE